jgi:hypothetical protein
LVSSFISLLVKDEREGREKNVVVTLVDLHGVDNMAAPMRVFAANPAQALDLPMQPL